MNINFGACERVLWPISIACGVIMSKISFGYGADLVTQGILAPNYWRSAFPPFLYSLFSNRTIEALFITKVYEVTRCFSSSRFQSYSRLSESQKIEWNNRGFSTFHAIVVAIVSFYLVVISDLFKDGAHPELIIDRKSVVSDAIFGISLGYFIYDLRMILWLFPALGGVEYIVHHGLSLYSFSLALLSGQAHLYILMVLFSEITTPFVNLRWYLDLSGLKSSKLYLWNGIALTLGWLFARIILFFFLFGHMYHNFDQVKTMFTLGFYSLLAVPSTLAVMNIFWFWKILRGLKKALSRKTHAQ